MPYDVIVSGHLCADLIPAMPDIPVSALAAPGKLFEVGMMAIIGDDLLGCKRAIHALAT